MFEDGFFEKNPQEFVASLANQYFCSSEDTFRYAMQKAGQGNWNQINQFVLIASMYSVHDHCIFYRMNRYGLTKSRSVPVTKRNGIIESIKVGNRTYKFRFDSDGAICGLLPD